MKVANRGLSYTALRSDLGLRHAHCREVGDQLFPVHEGASITSVSRYCGTGFPIVNIGTLINMRTPFGQRMYDTRKHAKLTQEQVRTKLKISQSTLSELENEANSSGHTTAFAKLYGCDAHWLATGQGESGLDADAPQLPSKTFQDRREVSESDWATLQAVKTLVPERDLDDYRERYVKLKAQAMHEIEEMAGRPKKPKP